MGFRFKKRIRIAPGININISKSGISTSLGGKGSTINISKKGVRSTVGIPGTGISYSTSLGKSEKKRENKVEDGFNTFIGFIAFLVILYLLIN